jgi:hypothetical protein
MYHKGRIHAGAPVKEKQQFAPQSPADKAALIIYQPFAQFPVAPRHFIEVRQKRMGLAKNKLDNKYCKADLQEPCLP